MVFNGAARVFGIIGNPLGHSLSPVFWNAAFAALNLNAVYVPFQVHEGKLAEALEGLSALSVSGVNVTMPWKERVVPYLSDLAAPADVLQAVNTIRMSGDGRREGFNTDHQAFLAIFDALNRSGPVTLLGAGGAGKTVLHGLCQRRCEMVYWANRNALRQQVTFPDEGTKIHVVAWNEPALKTAFSQSTMVINATTLGWRADDWLPALEGSLGPGKVFVDLNYGRQSRLLACARAAGATVIDGIEFLVQQGLAAFPILTQQQAPENVIRASIQAAVHGNLGRDSK